MIFIESFLWSTILLGYFAKLVFLILFILHLVCQVHFAKILSEHPTFGILAKLKLHPQKKVKIKSFLKF
jgi:hypothetical protein